MDTLAIMLLLGGSITVVLLACACAAFRTSWPALLAYWYPTEQTRRTESGRHLDNIEYAIYGMLRLAAAGLVGYGTLIVWGLSQA
jgi:hypothetical protein